MRARYSREVYAARGSSFLPWSLNEMAANKRRGGLKALRERALVARLQRAVFPDPWPPHHKHLCHLNTCLPNSQNSSMS